MISKGKAEIHLKFFAETNIRSVFNKGGSYKGDGFPDFNLHFYRPGFQFTLNL